MSDMFSTGELFAKRNNVFHSVDFLEFGDTLARWVSKITSNYVTDVVQGNGAIPAPDVTCPLTLQEMLLCLRNVMMGAFKETQSACQGLYPYSPSGSGDNQFVPYVAGASTCLLETLDMHLPIPFIENIRCLAGKKIRIRGNDVLWYAPVLGQYAMDVLASADYNTSSGLATVPAFTSGVLFNKREMSTKGEVQFKPMLETVVSLIDGSSGTALLAINDPARLKALISMWNSWLSESGVQSYSVQLGTFGTEKGITALSSISMTRHWVASIGGSEVPKLEEDLRLKGRYKSLVSTPYATRYAVIDTGQGTIIGPLYEQVLGTWILPQIETEVDSLTNSTLIQRWQFIMGEPYSTTLSSGDNGITLSTLHDSYASKMTKGKLAVNNDWTEFFAEQARLGRGGFLSSIVGGFIKSAIPGSAGLVDAVSGMVPF